MVCEGVRLDVHLEYNYFVVFIISFGIATVKYAYRRLQHHLAAILSPGYVLMRNAIPFVCVHRYVFVHLCVYAHIQGVNRSCLNSYSFIVKSVLKLVDILLIDGSN